MVTCQLGNLVYGACVGDGRKKILEHFLEPCSLLATELIIRIIKITPTVRVRRLGSARVICLFGVKNSDGYLASLLMLTLGYVGENILLSDRILVRWRIANFARDKLAIVFDINNFSKGTPEELVEFIRQKGIKIK